MTPLVYSSRGVNTRKIDLSVEPKFCHFFAVFLWCPNFFPQIVSALPPPPTLRDLFSKDPEVIGEKK